MSLMFHVSFYGPAVVVVPRCTTRKSKISEGN